MCVDSCVINKMIVKYKFPIPRLHDMLNFDGRSQNGSLRLSYVVSTIRIYIMIEDEWKITFKT